MSVLFPVHPGDLIAARLGKKIIPIFVVAASLDKGSYMHSERVQTCVILINNKLIRGFGIGESDAEFRTLSRAEASCPTHVGRRR